MSLLAHLKRTAERVDAIEPGEARLVTGKVGWSAQGITLSFEGKTETLLADSLVGIQLSWALEREFPASTWAQLRLRSPPLSRRVFLELRTRNGQKFRFSDELMPGDDVAEIEGLPHLSLSDASPFLFSNGFKAFAEALVRLGAALVVSRADEDRSMPLVPDVAHQAPWGAFLAPNNFVIGLLFVMIMTLVTSFLVVSLPIGANSRPLGVFDRADLNPPWIAAGVCSLGWLLLLGAIMLIARLNARARYSLAYGPRVTVDVRSISFWTAEGDDAKTRIYNAVFAYTMPDGRELKWYKDSSRSVVLQSFLSGLRRGDQVTMVLDVEDPTKEGWLLHEFGRLSEDGRWRSLRVAHLSIFFVCVSLLSMAATACVLLFP